MNIRLLLSVASFLSLVVSACQAPYYQADSIAPEASASGMQQQLIIKFKPYTFVCNVADVARFSAETHIPLQYIRPMSGGACVVKQMALPQDSLLEGRRVLKNQPAIEWLEEDRNMKTLR